MAGKSINRSKLNLFLDIFIALMFVVAMELRFTGLRIHELLGLGFGAGIVVHLLLHWKWILNITKHFFAKLFHESRFNYILNLALFVDVLVMIVSGVLISRTLGLNFGTLSRTLNFESIHIISSELSLIIVALHVAMHWKWIAAHSKKYLFSFKLPIQKRRSPQPNAIPAAQPISISQELYNGSKS